MSLSQVVSRHADRSPDSKAFGYAGETVSYGELEQRMQRAAGVLREAGVGRGDVVGVLLHNSLRFIDLMCGTAHLGAIFMPLNWRLTEAELEYILEHSGTRLLVSEPELASLLGDLPGRLGIECLGLDAPDGSRVSSWPSFEAAWDGIEPIFMPVDVALGDVHRLMYTSGTTSRPKGVMITHENLFWKCIGQIVELGIDASDRGLACGPLYHVGALDLITTNMLYVGASVDILRAFDAAAVLAAIERERTTGVWLAPAMVNAIVTDPAVDQRDLSSVRVVIDGGEKMPTSLIKRVTGCFPNAWFADAYGLTETVSGDTYLDKGNTFEKLGSVGKPILHTEIRVVDPDSGLPLPAGETGEICIRGPKVTKGYWRDPEATAEAIRGGWFHTGDLGYLDQDGYLFIVDRLKDVIVSGGENVSSLEVERVIYEHEGVLEAAVVAAPHPRWNQVPIAYVVAVNEGAVEEAELIAFCRERLAGFKAPKGIRVIDELPRNPSGKVLKRVLREREMAAAAAAEQGQASSPPST